MMSLGKCRGTWNASRGGGPAEGATARGLRAADADIVQQVVVELAEMGQLAQPRLRRSAEKARELAQPAR